MGCGASKGQEPLAPKQEVVPPAPATEFSPDSKPRTAEQPVEAPRPKESRDAAKRVDDIVKKGFSEFDDDTDTKKDIPDEPVQVATVPSLPAPPVTPPAAVQRLHGDPTANTVSRGPGNTAESIEAPFFPEQVSLNVGGTARTKSTSRTGMSTSVQAFDASYSFDTEGPVQRPLVISDVTAAASGVTAAAGTSPQQAQRTVAPPGPHLFAPPSIKQRLPQLQPLIQPQQSIASSSPSFNGQPQPLMESGSSGPGPSAAMLASSQSHPHPSADDPWSSLQSQYRIREPSKMNSNLVGGVSGANSGRVGLSTADSREEMLVLGDDDEFSGTRSAMNTTMNRTARTTPPLAAVRPGEQPKKGGWGSGAMAQAGQLMIGEDDWLLEGSRTPGTSGGLQLPPPQMPGPRASTFRGPSGDAGGDEVVSVKEPRPVAKSAATKVAKDDVLCEDIEDVDMLLEDEMERHGLSNKNLANKLAGYESKFGTDDD